MSVDSAFSGPVAGFEDWESLDMTNLQSSDWLLPRDEISFVYNAANETVQIGEGAIGKVMIIVACESTSSLHPILIFFMCPKFDPKPESFFL